MPEISKLGGKSRAREFIGTAAQRIALNTNNLPVGSAWIETDTNKIYLFDGTAWQEV